MRGGDEHDDGGHHGVHTQPDQAEPVDHHRRELPVRDHHLLLILLSHSLCQESERDIQMRDPLIAYGMEVASNCSY